MICAGSGEVREGVGLSFLQEGSFLVKFFNSKDVFSVDIMVMG